jgi:hypothetical protein
MPVVDSYAEESPQNMVLGWLSDPDDLRMVCANREAKQGIAVVASSQVVTLRTVATHTRHNLRDSWIRVAELDPAVLVSAMVVLGNDAMAPNGREGVSGDRHDREENRWEM